MLWRVTRHNESMQEDRERKKEIAKQHNLGQRPPGVNKRAPATPTKAATPEVGGPASLCTLERLTSRHKRGEKKRKHQKPGGASDFDSVPGCCRNAMRDCHAAVGTL